MTATLHKENFLRQPAPDSRFEFLCELSLIAEQDPRPEIWLRPGEVSPRVHPDHADAWLRRWSAFQKSQDTSLTMKVTRKFQLAGAPADWLNSEGARMLISEQADQLRIGFALREEQLAEESKRRRRRASDSRFDHRYPRRIGEDIVFAADSELRLGPVALADWLNEGSKKGGLSSDHISRALKARAKYELATLRRCHRVGIASDDQASLLCIDRMYARLRFGLFHDALMRSRQLSPQPLKGALLARDLAARHDLFGAVRRAEETADQSMILLPKDPDQESVAA